MSLRRRAATPRNYRPVDADDHSAHIFELEAARVQGDEAPPRQAPRRSLVFPVACLVFSLLFGIATYAAREETEAAESERRTYSIFCYGDSLTHGTSDASDALHPYAEYLEEELHRLAKSTQAEEAAPTQVRHLGLPGWTASSLLNHVHDGNVGLCNIIENTPTLALVIILVGTNDIGQMTNVDKAAGRSIIQSIVDLHTRALQCAEGEARVPFRTLAVGIPGSAFQDMTPAAADMAAYVNGAVETFAASRDEVSYFDFPLPYREADERWSSDGLHLTPAGYRALAEALAPQVQKILNGMDSL